MEKTPEKTKKIEKPDPLHEMMAEKVKQLSDVRAKLQQLDAQRQQLLEGGLELQGAIKQLNEIVNAQAKSNGTKNK